MNFYQFGLANKQINTISIISLITSRIKMLLIFKILKATKRGIYYPHSRGACQIPQSMYELTKRGLTSGHVARTHFTSHFISTPPTTYILEPSTSHPQLLSWLQKERKSKKEWRQQFLNSKQYINFVHHPSSHLKLGFLAPLSLYQFKIISSKLA